MQLLVPVRNVFIDDSGSYIEGAVALQRTLSDDSSVSDLASYSVRNLGFVWLCIRPAGAEIRLRPKTVTSEALAQLIYWLIDNPSRRVMLASLEERWQYSIASNRMHLMATIYKLMEAAAARKGPNYLSSPNPRLRETYNLLSDQLRQRAANCACIGEIARICRDLFGARFTLVEADESGRFSIVDIGRGYRFIDTKWGSSAVGSMIEEYPDRTYGRWVATGLRRAIRKGGSSFESVDVMINHPTSGRRRFRYDRLVVALLRASGPPLALTSSVPNPGIDLRIAHG